jgi:hypothetical protein
MTRLWRLFSGPLRFVLARGAPTGNDADNDVVLVAERIVAASHPRNDLHTDT